MEITLAQLAALPYREAVATFKEIWVQMALERNFNNQCAIAETSGIHRNTVRRIMQCTHVQPVGKRKVRERSALKGLRG